MTNFKRKVHDDPLLSTQAGVDKYKAQFNRGKMYGNNLAVKMFVN